MSALYFNAISEFVRYFQNVSGFELMCCLTVCVVLCVFINRYHGEVSFTYVIINGIYLTVLFSVTLIGRDNSSSSSINTLFITYDKTLEGNLGSLYGMILNVLMFIIPGVYFTKFFSVGKKIIIIIGLSFFIEICQLITKRGVFEICDLLDNLIGGLIGIGLYALMKKSSWCLINK